MAEVLCFSHFQMSSIYHILVINRAGSLIFDYENKENDGGQRVERTYNWPMGIVLELIDQRPTVVFGEGDGVRLRFWADSINGKIIKSMLKPFSIIPFIV